MTHLFIILGCLAVAGAGAWLRRRSVLWGTGLVYAGCVGLVGTLIVQARQTVFAPTARPPNRAHAVVSFFLANQVLQEVAGRSGTVVLVFPPERLLSAEAAESYENAFTPLLLRGHPELQVQTVRLNLTDKGTGPVQAAAFQQTLAKYAGALAVVSYAGLPSEPETLFAASQPGRPGLFVFDPDRTTRWLAPLKQGLIRAVIVPRPDVDPASQAGIAGLPGEIFSQLYLMAIPATADQVAARLTTGK